MQRRPGITWHLGEMFVTLRGEPYLLCRAADEHGAELDVLVQKRGDKAAAKRYFRRVLRSNPSPPQDRCRPVAPLLVHAHLQTFHFSMERLRRETLC